MLLESARNMNVINGNRLIGMGYPVDEGAQLATRLLQQEDVDWQSLTLDMTDVDAAMLISSFVNSFLQTIHEQAPLRLDQARKVQWKTEFGFQQESIEEWVNDFQPEAVH
ncbi:hypothetical protein [Rubripirellula obstinata]|nr:hypothetical protein [Rubripirellula obstinata]